MALTFNRKFDPRYGTTVAVAPQVKRIVCANAGPFTFAGTNSYIIGGDSVVILDPGPADRSHLAALTAAIGRRTVRQRLGSCAIKPVHRSLAPGRTALPDGSFPERSTHWTRQLIMIINRIRNWATETALLATVGRWRLSQRRATRQTIWPLRWRPVPAKNGQRCYFPGIM